MFKFYSLLIIISLVIGLYSMTFFILSYKGNVNNKMFFIEPVLIGEHFISIIESSVMKSGLNISSLSLYLKFD